MKTTEFLGPFRNLPNYQDRQLLLDMPETQEQIATTHHIGQSCCFDFDVRPQRTCLTNGRHLRLVGQGADWDEILYRCALSVARTLGLVGSSYSVERGIEGEDSNGSVVCWLRVNRPNWKVLSTALTGLFERIKRQDWPQHHPERVPAEHPDSLIWPGQDRISIQILDPQTHHRVPMLAENFYFVNQGKGQLHSFPLKDWPQLLNNLKGG
jgi:hypothetical protein